MNGSPENNSDDGFTEQYTQKQVEDTRRSWRIQGGHGGFKKGHKGNKML